MSETHFDLLVVGGGSGGLATARRAAKYGARVALVEAAELGGTCVNRGCVPKKMLWNAAQVAEAQRDASSYGFAVVDPVFEWGRFKKSREVALERLRSIYDKNLSVDGVTLIRGWAKLLPSKQLRVADATYSAEHMLLAMGGAPRFPAIPGAELGVTSDGFFEWTEQPRRVGVVGGGYIAVETAGVLRALGSEVTLVMRGKEPLKGFDELLRRRVHEELSAHGTTVVCEFEPSRVEKAAEGLFLVGHDASRLGGFDALIWATGRVPRSAGVGLDELGVNTDARGYVIVDDWQNTTAAGVYAVGDITGRIELTPVAIAAGRKLADRLFGGKTDAKLDYADVPTVVFSHPPIATVGMTEAAAREAFGQLEVKVYTTQFADSYMTFAHRRVMTSMKVVCVGETEKVVGIHCIGRSVDEIIQGFAVALRMGATKADLDRTVAIHPTAAEELVTLR